MKTVFRLLIFVVKFKKLEIIFVLLARIRIIAHCVDIYPQLIYSWRNYYL